MEKLYNLFKSSKGISTDSRKIKHGEMFFALNGERYDGSKFVLQALEKGASHVVTENNEYENFENVTIVPDTLKSLQLLARFHRQKLETKIIALTGSNGKTTTKELLFAGLSEKYSVTKTIGNFNNHIGVPLTLFKIKKHHEFAIVEMGANKLGDIEELCNIADPDYGIVTNIGMAHLEGFGSKKGVFDTKTELYRYIKNKNGKVFIDSSEDELLTYAKSIKLNIELYNKDDVEIIPNKNVYTIDFLNNDSEIEAKLFGLHNVQNYLCAFGIAQYFGVNNIDLIKALSLYTSDNMRSQIIEQDGKLIYLDAYNANYSSMSLSIKHFQQNKADTIVILGDMKEMGQDSSKYHNMIVSDLINSNWGKVILVGSEFAKTDMPNTFLHFQNVDLLIEMLKQNQVKGKFYLIKGSRSIALEKILGHL